MLFDDGGKKYNTKKKSKMFYLIFPLNPHSSRKSLADSLGLQRHRVKWAPAQTAGNRLVHGFLRIYAVLQVAFI